jgi:hypothetical protein
MNHEHVGGNRKELQKHRRRVPHWMWGEDGSGTRLNQVEFKIDFERNRVKVTMSQMCVTRGRLGHR